MIRIENEKLCLDWLSVCIHWAPTHSTYSLEILFLSYKVALSRDGRDGSSDGGCGGGGGVVVVVVYLIK